MLWELSRPHLAKGAQSHGCTFVGSWPDWASRCGGTVRYKLRTLPLPERAKVQESESALSVNPKRIGHTHAGTLCETCCTFTTCFLRIIKADDSRRCSFATAVAFLLCDAYLSQRARQTARFYVGQARWRLPILSPLVEPPDHVTV